MLHIAAAQEFFVVEAHQEGKVGKDLHEARLIKLLFENDVDDAHGQEVVGTRLDRNPKVRRLGRGVEFGCDDDHFAAVVFTFPDEVGVGDPRNTGVTAPEDGDVGGVHEIIRSADVPFAVGHGRTGKHVAQVRGGIDTIGTHLGREAQRTAAATFGQQSRTGMHHQVFGTFIRIGHDVPHFLSHQLRRLVPADALPFALAAFTDAHHRIENAVFFVHHL